MVILINTDIGKIYNSINFRRAYLHRSITWKGTNTPIITTRITISTRSRRKSNPWLYLLCMQDDNSRFEADRNLLCTSESRWHATILRYASTKVSSIHRYNSFWLHVICWLSGMKGNVNWMYPWAYSCLNWWTRQHIKLNAIITSYSFDQADDWIPGRKLPSPFGWFWTGCRSSSQLYNTINLKKYGFDLDPMHGECLKSS